MRARNLKPGFFKNELLGSADPLYGTLYQGLWCMADREGRLEDRPLRISAEVFPYRRNVSEKRVDAMLQWLHEAGFVARYEVCGERFIQVLTFLKHNNPHLKEKPSAIPPVRPVSHSASTGKAPDEPGKGTSSPGLFSESGILNPESPLLNSESGILNPSSADSAAGSSNGRAAAGERASAMERSTRRSKGNGKTGKEPAELRQDAMRLAEAGMGVGDIAHTLQQYGVTAAQVRDWIGAGA